MAHVLALPIAHHSVPAIEIQSVSKSFAVNHDVVQALSNISLSVRTGEFVSLVGPSGCGKSTLLRLLAGLEQPDTGSLLEHGRSIDKPSLRRGMVFQDHRLLPWLTVEQNIRLGMANIKDAVERDDVFETLISLVRLQAFRQAYPHQLSGGMSQRAAIARSLAAKPRLLLLDEPLGALDSLTRRYLQAELLRIWEHEGITMVMVTHDVDEAVFLSDRVIVLEPRPGRIKGVVEVPSAKPRNRTDIRYVECREAIVDLLEK
jgi:sulfonate transport system ATP-binding protein